MQHGAKSDRNKKMIKRVLNGETLKQIGIDNNISATTVRTIFYQAMRRLVGHKYPGLVKPRLREIKSVKLQAWRSCRNYILNRL